MARTDKELGYEEFAARVLENFPKDDAEWVKQFKDYAKSVSKKQDKFLSAAEEIKSKLNSEKTGLYLYTRISRFNKGYAFDLRYQGESIAEISIGKKLKLVKSSRNYTIDEFIGEFDWKQEFEKFKGSPVELNGALDTFTKYFKPDFIRQGFRKGNNNEHKYESMILTLMGKPENEFSNSFEPIMLCGCRFQLPTKFRASKVESGEVPVWREDIGGGADILALHNGRLAVIELKDEGENPKYVMLQAIVYAVFLHKLLRKCEKWKEILGCQNIKGIDAVICMPEPTPNYEKETPDRDASITFYDDGDKVTINLRYIYFKAENDEFTIVKQSEDH